MIRFESFGTCSKRQIVFVVLLGVDTEELGCVGSASD